MNRLSQYRIFAILIPILCLAIGAWITWKQHERLEAARAEDKKVEADIAFQVKMIQEIGSQPLAEKEPTAPASDAEQAAFLDGLRTIARDSGVILTSWSNVAAPPADKDKPQNYAGAMPMLSTLEVVGPFENVRAFLYSIARAPRLLNFSGIKWSRAEESKSDVTKLSVTITRYVSNDLPPAPEAPTTAARRATDKSS